jgi:type III secretory pathway lipoprotein EscJ
MNRTATLLLPLALTSCGAPAPPDARDDHEKSGIQELLGRSLLPSPEEDRLLRDNAVAAEIALTVGGLPNVASARVHLDSGTGLMASARRPPRALVVVHRERPGAGPEVAVVRQIVQAAVREIEADEIQVIDAGPPAAAAELVTIGPIRVAASEAGHARLILGGLLGLVLALGVTLIWAGVRLRRARVDGATLGQNDPLG